MVGSGDDDFIAAERFRAFPSQKLRKEICRFTQQKSDIKQQD
jgi:hypothetical protein